MVVLRSANFGLLRGELGELARSLRRTGPFTAPRWDDVSCGPCMAKCRVDDQDPTRQGRAEEDVCRTKFGGLQVVVLQARGCKSKSDGRIGEVV